MVVNFENTQIAFESRTDAGLKKAKFLFKSMGNPWLTKIGITLTQIALKYNFPIHSLIRNTIFEQFCGGETLAEAGETAKKLEKYGISVIMDYGVEGKSNEEEYEKTVNTFIETIQFSANKSYIPFISLKITGFARFELLEKLHKHENLTDLEGKEFDRVFERIDKICKCAFDHQKMILIDAEESWIQGPVDVMADDMMRKYNTDQTIVFNTFQLYRHDRLEFLKESFQKACKNGYLLGAKLVRGAYMEKERIRAKELGYESPIQTDKLATDKDYDLGISFCLDHHQQICLFVGTHNEKSCEFAVEKMMSMGISADSGKVYFSQLFGMSDNISFNLSRLGYPVSKYLPYGPVKDVIPYLMRRAQENTSVAGQTGRELSLISKELNRRNGSKESTNS